MTVAVHICSSPPAPEASPGELLSEGACQQQASVKLDSPHLLVTLCNGKRQPLKALEMRLKTWIQPGPGHSPFPCMRVSQSSAPFRIHASITGPREMQVKWSQTILTHTVSCKSMEHVLPKGLCRPSLEDCTIPSLACLRSHSRLCQPTLTEKKELQKMSPCHRCSL